MPVSTKKPRVNPKAMDGTSMSDARVVMLKERVKESLQMKIQNIEENSEPAKEPNEGCDH
jgi:hypothetical protein